MDNATQIYYAEKWRERYWHIGNWRYVEACKHAESPVVQVNLNEDPDGDYWGWIDTNCDQIVMVQPQRGLFDMQFTYGPEAEVKRGRGRIVRLRIAEVAQSE